MATDINYSFFLHDVNWFFCSVYILCYAIILSVHWLDIVVRIKGLVILFCCLQSMHSWDPICLPSTCLTFSLRVRRKSWIATSRKPNKCRETCWHIQTLSGKKRISAYESQRPHGSVLTITSTEGFAMVTSEHKPELYPPWYFGILYSTCLAGLKPCLENRDNLGNYSN